MKQPNICDVYKSLRGDEMYLFVSRADEFNRVPDTLLTRFNTEKTVASFVLTPEKKLARVDADKVITALTEQGFFLQMPPPKQPMPEADMKNIADLNEKLSR